VRILGVELARRAVPGGGHTLVLLDDQGAVHRHARLDHLPAVAATVAEWVGDDPYLLGVDIPVVVPAKPSRSRPVESIARRNFGYRLPPGGRSADQTGVPGEALMAGLATAGLPCLPYPDRDRRRSGLAETHTGLILKCLLWESGSLATTPDRLASSELFRAYSAPAYRREDLPSRRSWADQAVALELVVRALADVEGYDLAAAREALQGITGDAEAEHAAALFDAILIASTARRYMEAPERSLFLGDQGSGYLILPADGFIRRLASTDKKTAHGELFPQTSLREMLGSAARLRSLDLLDVPGKPHRIDATFEETPRYEFDNLDEMLWWKHCRHLAGPKLPTRGLHELVVVLADEERDEPRLRLVRSRHRTLSFRFDPPVTWRAYVPTRDGNTYSFRVERAVYDTLPA
jgi:predicted RNase H-like nuclease